MSETSTKHDLPIINRSEPSSANPSPPVIVSSLPKVGLSTAESLPCVIIQHVGSKQSQSQAVAEGSHKCEECDYTSNNKHYLKQHVDLVHNPERPYKCPFCDYAGKRSHSLREHLVVHTNERPYECEHCNASFRKKGHLTNHIKLHITHKFIKCSLCSAYLINQESFKKHIEEMHGQDKVFVCEVCNFASAARDIMVEHVATHETMFKCSDCSFVTSDFDNLTEHAKDHVVKDVALANAPPMSSGNQGLESKTESNQSFLKQSEPTKVPVMIKCTECGFTAPNPDIVKNHMWVHITGTGSSKVNIVKPKKKPNIEPPFKVVQLQQDDNEIKVIEAKLPENAAYKCTDCSFVHKDAKVFIKHMLTHRLKSVVNDELVESDSPPAKTQVELQQLSSAEDKGDQKFIVTPVTKENTCKNTEKAPFTHDPVSGRFRCIICGYSCEYQRTIKAHIWKHSGNKAIDYPMFQNGPLSMYDDLPTPKSVFCNQEEETVENVLDKNIPVAAHEEVVNAKHLSSQSSEQISSENDPTGQVVPVLNSLGSPPPATAMVSTTTSSTDQSAIDKAIANVKLVKTDVTSKFGMPICHVQTVDGKTLTLFQDTENMPIGVENKVIKLEQAIEVKSSSPPKSSVGVEMNHLPERTDDSNILPKLTLEQNQQLEIGPSIVHVNIKSDESPEHPVDVKVIANANQMTIPIGDECIEKIEDEIVSPDKPLEVDTMVDTVNVLVETVETVPTSSDFTGLYQQASPRIHEEWSEGCVETVLDQAPTAIKAQATTMVTRARTRQAARKAQAESEQIKVLQAKQLVLLAQEAAKEENLPIDVKGVVTRAKKTSEEALTLLSLLRKGQNINSAADSNDHYKKLMRTENDSETESENETLSEDHSSDSKPKTGICSSLLAVIEQLRERSKSESEPDEAGNSKNMATKRQLRRRSKVESTEEDVNLDSVENMEMIDEEGEPKYRCKLCHYSNSKPLILKLHMRLHKSKQPFECSLCDYIANSSEHLQEHMIRHCKMRTYPCKLCSSTFNYKSQLRAHMRAHSDRNPLTCHICQFETKSPIHYRNHLRYHANQYYQKCDLCKKLFPTKCELKAHKREECYKDNPDSLESGSSDSDSDVALDGKKDLKCSLCDFTTKSATSLKGHSIAHEEHKLLKCHLCDFTAVSSRSLKSHMKRHINDQRYVQQPLEQYKCNLCGYVCHHLPSLKSHMWRHASDRNYSYEFTNDVINAAIDYDCRIDSVSSDPDLLDKILISEKNILEGRLNNSLGPDGQQPVCWVVFKCCQCGFETINKAQLNMHMTSHSDIIQRTLEVSHGHASPPTHNQGQTPQEPGHGSPKTGSKRPSSNSLSKEDKAPIKTMKTQHHG